MNRRGRRAHNAQQKVLKFNSEAIQKRVVAQVTLGLGELGPEIREALLEQLGGREPTDGEMADSLMQCAARFRQTVKNDDPSAAYASVISIVWLAQALAMRRGVIPPEPDSGAAG